MTKSLRRESNRPRGTLQRHTRTRAHTATATKKIGLSKVAPFRLYFQFPAHARRMYEIPLIMYIVYTW